MAIEFETVVARIEDSAARERERAETEAPPVDEGRLLRLMREEQARMMWRAARLRA